MKYSIVIPNYNGEKLLRQNLPAVLNAIDNDGEVIVVDDASTDNSVKMLQRNFPQVRIVLNPQNLRFAMTCNKGVENANGEVVILLNSDVVPEKDFIKPLLQHFDDSQVFSVGCREIEMVSGKQVFSGRTEGKFEKGLYVHRKPIDQDSQQTAWTFGGSMAVAKSKYLELGGFDPIYAPAYWEDIDLSFRARGKGWKVIFEKNAVVHHNHETTNLSIFGQQQIQSISLRNQIIFSWRNLRSIQLLKHLLWLPYHLVITSMQTRGLFFISFIQALKTILVK